MPILIYAENPSQPGLIAKTTHQTLQTLFPKQKVLFSATLDLTDYASDKTATLVLPGNHLFLMAEEMELSSAKKNCIEAVDNGAHFVGFCAGAFYGAPHFIAQKTARLNQRYEENPIIQDYLGSLNMIEGVCALGPFLPYQQAISDGHGLKFHPHAVLIKDNHDRKFLSLYLEGPLFLKHTEEKLCYPANNVIAEYVLDYSLTVTLCDKNKKIKSTLDVGNLVPAVMHAEHKGSHRFLIGPHPELSAAARTFIPAFEKESFYGTDQPTLTIPDRVLLCNADNEAKNLEFLRETLSVLKM